MARRPRYTLDTFLKHIFSPSKNPQPSGLRKHVLSGLRGGRSKARLNAFNKMPAKNQAILDRAGMRDAYLRGDAKLADAKRVLREQAVQKGFVKPLRPRTPKAATPAPTARVRQRGEGWQVFHHLNNLNDSDRKDPRAIAALVNLMNDEQRARALSFTRYDQILAAGTSKPNGAVQIGGTLHDAEDVVYIDDHPFNVFWYHSGGM